MRFVLLLLLSAMLCSCASVPPPIPDSLRADQTSFTHGTSLQQTVTNVSSAWGNGGRRGVIMDRAREFGLEQSLRTEWIDWFSLQSNVIIDLPGTSPKTVYVVAHYDKTDMNPVRLVSTMLNGIFDDLLPFLSEGAADNGTGVAVAMELAQAISRRDHFLSYRFLFPGSEESGLRGTRAHLAALSTEEAERIQLAVNIDTVGVDFSDNCVSEGDFSEKALDAAKRSDVSLTLAPPATANDSDYAPFQRNGFLNDFLLGLENNYLGGLLPQRSWFSSSFVVPTVNFSACGMSGSQGTGNLSYPVHGPSDTTSHVDIKRLYEQFLIVNELLLTEDRLAATTHCSQGTDTDSQKPLLPPP